MRTLVIHPADRSTDFLKEIYWGKDWKIINDRDACRSRKVITQLIKKHDRIIMMGHGYPGGLFFTCINSQMVYLLRQKECVCIWCNADQFVRRYNLKGFFTGMFISEVGEAAGRGITVGQEEVTASNNLFAVLMGDLLTDDRTNVLAEIKTSYVGDSEVISFNHARLYYRVADDDDDTMEQERLLAERDLEDEMKEAELNSREDNDESHYLLIY
jgi:hypothetical protein